VSLGYGYNRGVPEDVTTVWGARLIAPADLVHDRQDLVAESDEAKQALIAWLNGGAISQALAALRERYVRGDSDEEFVIFEDDRGKIVGNAQASHGYVYVAGWLKV
jgi:hypothetical protein